VTSAWQAVPPIQTQSFLQAKAIRLRPDMNGDMTLGNIDADEAIRCGPILHHPVSLMRTRTQTTVRVDRDEPAGTTRSAMAFNGLFAIGLPAGPRPSVRINRLRNGQNRSSGLQIRNASYLLPSLPLTDVARQFGAALMTFAKETQPLGFADAANSLRPTNI
jgi:hypothetical protein